MKRPLLLITFLLSSCLSQPKIGETIHPSPGDWAGRGVCIFKSENYEKLCSYSVSIFERNSTPQLVVSLKKITREADGHPTWKIIDTVALPRYLAGKIIESGICRYNEKADDSIVAVVDSYGENSPEYIRAQGWAYKVDESSGKFMKINADAVDCINTAIGAD